MTSYCKSEGAGLIPWRATPGNLGLRGDKKITNNFQPNNEPLLKKISMHA